MFVNACYGGFQGREIEFVFMGLVSWDWIGLDWRDWLATGYMCVCVYVLDKVPS